MPRRHFMQMRPNTSMGMKHIGQEVSPPAPDRLLRN